MEDFVASAVPAVGPAAVSALLWAIWYELRAGRQDLSRLMRAVEAAVRFHVNGGPDA